MNSVRKEVLPCTNRLPALRSQVRQSRERLDRSAIGTPVPAVEDDEGGSELDNNGISRIPDPSFFLNDPVIGTGGGTSPKIAPRGRREAVGTEA